MLFPQNNTYRQKTILAQYWDFLVDDNASLTAKELFISFPGQSIAVPASWNEQFVGLRDYLGTGWYRTDFDLPWGYDGKKIFLRFGSVNYIAQVWLNGAYLGEHEGGHLPFEFEVDSHLKPESNVLLVRVDAQLASDRVPPGNLESDDERDAHHRDNWPATTYDFFPYAGIHRPVVLYAVPNEYIVDIRVETDIINEAGIVNVHVTLCNEGEIELELSHHNDTLSSTTTTEARLEVINPQLWSPEHPNLYNLKVRLKKDSRDVDEYNLAVGIRTVEVKGHKLLLNGQEITLKGFGRHEDFPVIGRGEMPAVTIKDYSLMKWVGANSFRTSHYPYAEETLDLADRMGYLVIAETASVGLFFKEEGLDKRLHLTKKFARELMERDKNHPSVIIWSLANEARTTRPGAVEYFREVYDYAKKIDTTRPITIVSDMFSAEDSFDFFDIVCLNIYRGWYQESGRLDDGFASLSRILKKTYMRFGKPIIVTEFGADAIAGHHSLPSEMFSEEYQMEFIEGYIKEMNQCDFVVGQHIWNMCDFKTGQGVKRPMAMNFKGVFTRNRNPKMAAHRLKSLWASEK